jgi:methylated-DNA-[protein]-cysteine S-methyltransferase
VSGYGQTIRPDMSHDGPMPQDARSTTTAATDSYCYTDTPLGAVLLTASDGVLSGLYFADHAHSPQLTETAVHDPGTFDELRRQLDAYFAGRRFRFGQSLALRGSPFDLAVWASLRTIPLGTTTSYGEIARRIGQPQAARAVGAANGRNPISIIVPCHRVIGADGSLTGYGWGVERKAWLLEHERRNGSAEVRRRSDVALVTSPGS